MQYVDSSAAIRITGHNPITALEMAIRRGMIPRSCYMRSGRNGRYYRFNRDALERWAGSYEVTRKSAFRRIQCPRCPAVGDVYEESDDTFTIVWSKDGQTWVDALVVNPAIGCGYDV